MTKGAAFVFGWLVSLAVVVTVTVAATGDNPPRSNTVPSLASLAVRVAIGAALVWIGVRQRRRAGQPRATKKTPKWQTNVDGMSPLFAMGLAPALQPWGLIAAGAATVTQAKLSDTESYLVLLLFCLLASSSYLATELFAGFRPEDSQVLLARIRSGMEAHTDQIVIFGSLILGLWLIADSLYQILT